MPDENASVGVGLRRHVYHQNDLIPWLFAEVVAVIGGNHQLPFPRVRGRARDIRQLGRASAASGGGSA
ncbi:hypothetical protein ACVWZL_007078 [Bradyrhizobium sp. GM2.4]